MIVAAVILILVALAVVANFVLMRLIDRLQSGEANVFEHKEGDDPDLIAAGWKFRSHANMWVHPEKSVGQYVNTADARRLQEGDDKLLASLRASIDADDPMPAEEEDEEGGT
jgi:hypothetical protein